jgi:hypothetical protein
MEIIIVEQEENDDVGIFEDEVNKWCYFANDKHDEERHLIDVNVYCKPNKLSLYYAVIKYRIVEENN